MVTGHGFFLSGLGSERPWFLSSALGKWKICLPHSAVMLQNRCWPCDRVMYRMLSAGTPSHGAHCQGDLLFWAEASTLHRPRSAVNVVHRGSCLE